MIRFLVIIEEDRQWRVHLHCETPPGSCSVAERTAGLEFKAMFEDLARKHSTVHVVRPWAVSGQKPQGN